jgi:cell division protein YceG involved in septum cleavage
MLKTLRIVAIIIFFVGLIFSAPPSFPLNKAIAIEKGQSQKAISSLLKNNGVISSRSIFNLCVTLNAKGDSLQAGVYVFEKNISVKRVKAGFKFY